MINDKQDMLSCSNHHLKIIWDLIRFWLIFADLIMFLSRTERREQDERTDNETSPVGRTGTERGNSGREQEKDRQAEPAWKEEIEQKTNCRGKDKGRSCPDAWIGGPQQSRVSPLNYPEQVQSSMNSNTNLNSIQIQKLHKVKSNAD